ncbi:MAG TPA: ornithine cyclodeaminase family protein [Pyrinomonadaceae bacterium]|jgi:alanine dehydrogenase|nr:ornithine cyclodeaminase family protein [Pyrinomonadaceae bacterium]
MKTEATLFLTRGEVASLLGLDECIDAVEEAFRLYAEGSGLPPGVLETLTEDGGFHIKAAGLRLAGGSYFAAKVNGNFPLNQERFGLPTIQGVVVLCDAERGRPLAVMDSMELTALRTAAATGVAARYLARPDSKVATVCGCGIQGRAQLRALARVLRIEKVYAFDRDDARAESFAREMSEELRVGVEAAPDLGKAAGASDVSVTCTPSRQPVLMRGDVRPGTFVAAVGADNPLKQELDPALMASGKIVVDILEQCATIGDLHHALEAGAVTKDDVYAELGEIVAGRKPGRASDEEIVIFDSTGTALQDVAAAAVVYEKALRDGVGMSLNLAG